MPGSNPVHQVEIDEPAESAKPEAMASAAPVRWQWPRLVLWAGTTSLGLVLIAILVLGQAKPSSAERPIPYDQSPQVQAVELARLAYLRADYDVAKGHVAKAMEVAHREQDTNAMAEAIRVEGEILAAQGSLEEAYKRFQMSLAIRVPFKQSWGRASLLTAMATVEQKLGKLDEAEMNLRNSLATMQQVHDPGGAAEALRELGSIAAKRGDRSTARKRFAAARAAISDRPKEAMHIDIRARVALLLADEGKYDLALKDLKQCLKEWRELNHPRWIATTLLQIGKVEWSAGKHKEARQAIEEAKVNYEAVGDRLGVRECSGWLADRLGSQRLARATTGSRRTPN
jgi:tetratricopeptide (TPR) repeat protein